MRKDRLKSAAALLLAGAFVMGCFSACGGGPAPEDPGPAVPAPEPAARPELVEPPPPELPPAAVVNGDFEQGFDAQGQLRGWTVEFSEWGEGEAAAVYRPSTEADNPENTTQKLSLYNGTAGPVDFSVSQTVQSVPAGEYVVSLIFEGGPAGIQTGTRLSVNGVSAEFGLYSGWRNWKQVVSPKITVEENGEISIAIQGQMDSKDWMDLDDVELVLADAFRARSFGQYAAEAAAPAAPGGEPVLIYDRLTNGSFDLPEDENGRLPGWTVEFADWGAGEKRAAYRLTRERENINTSQKLSLGNSTGRDNSFTIRQQFRAGDAGEYVLAFDWEAGSGQLTGFSLSVNGEQTFLGSGKGWNCWQQAASRPIRLEAGDVVQVEIRGTMADGEWMDLDNVILVRSSRFSPKGGSSDREPSPPVVLPDSVQNGDFSQGLDWSFPNGRLPGWTLPRSIDWNRWRFNTDSPNTFEVNNISSESGASSFTISQQLRLKPDTYTLGASSPWVKDDGDSVSAVTVTVAPAKGQADGLPASLSVKPGGGRSTSPAFTVAEETLVELRVTFSLRGGATAAVKDLELAPVPEAPEQIANGDFSQGIIWDDPRYPDGRLPGWELPRAVDWDKWAFNTASNAFDVTNRSAESGASPFTISQQVRLKPDTYTLDANSPWFWDGSDSVSAVTVTVTEAAAGRARAAGGLPVTLSMKPGCGKGSSARFTLTEETLTDVTVTFSLVGGANAAIRELAFTPVPETPPEPETIPVAWTDAVQAGGDSGQADTTAVDITFSREVPGLTAGHFTVEGAVAGSLTGGTDGAYRLAVSGITVEDGETITLSVTGPEGYEITPASRTVQVWRAGGGPPAPEATPVTWTGAVQAGGDSGLVDSTTVDITFSREVPGLTAGHFTVEGAAAGALTGGTDGTYWLAISDITVEDGETITVSVASPEGYEITPASQTVQVWRKDEEEPFVDPLRNKTFSDSTDELGWSVPTGWTLRLGGAVIAAKADLDQWVTDNGGSDTSGIKLGTVEDQGAYIGIRGYSGSLKDFSLTQTVFLEPGDYKLNYALTPGDNNAFAWGLIFEVPETGDSIDAGNCTAGAGSLEFTVESEDDYTISISIPDTWPTYFELHSVSLEKLT